MPREFFEILGTLLEEGIAALFGLRRSIGQTGGLSGKELLSHHAVVGEVEPELQHPHGRGRLGVHHLGPVQGRLSPGPYDRPPC